MLRKIRITLAAAFFCGIVLLFLDFTGSLHTWLGWMARVQLIPAVLALNLSVILMLAALTFLFGRIYCSVVCPLGVMQDIFGWMGEKRKKHRYSYSKAVSWLRYTVLSCFIVALAAGFGSLVQLLEPYSAFGRIMTMIFQPLWRWGNNVLASMAERLDSYTFYSVDVWLKSLPVLLIALLTMAVLFVLAWRGGRTYCNTICPVGTLLSVLARFSWMKIRIDADKCHSCSLCARDCKASCIDFRNHRIDHSRCVVCGNCIDSCKSGALSYGRPKPSPAKGKAPDAGKRSFLLASAMVTTAAIAQESKKVDGGLADIIEKKAPGRHTPVTPPGSLSARNMATRCTGCQLCVSECPNEVLRPSTDLMHLMQPVMSFERGYCRPECTRCSEVCPTGAIQLIDSIQKSSIQTGHAVVAIDHCLSALGETECGNCARHCPAGAIEMIPSDPDDELSPSLPAVNESACIGCGACEHLCPVRPLSAIHVEGHLIHQTI